jgi:hypothetical protein
LGDGIAVGFEDVPEAPAGSKPAIEEEIAIFSESDVEVFDTTTVTRSEHHLISIEVDVDVSRFQTGRYFLGVRDAGLTWTEYRVRIP